MHWAIKRNNYDIADLLISHGANLDLKDSLNRLPIDIAKKIKNDKIINVIFIL